MTQDEFGVFLWDIQKKKDYHLCLDMALIEIRNRKYGQEDSEVLTAVSDTLTIFGMNPSFQAEILRHLEGEGYINGLHITIKGVIFLEKTGYTGQLENERRAERLKTAGIWLAGATTVIGIVASLYTLFFDIYDRCQTKPIPCIEQVQALPTAEKSAPNPSK